MNISQGTVTGRPAIVQKGSYAFGAEIDSLVCELYGLTAEEIRILEESGRTTDP